MELLYDSAGVGGTVEKIGIAKCDVTCSSGYLLTDITQNYLGLHHPELPLINRHNGAVST